LNDLFMGIDSDGDGIISADEVRGCLEGKSKWPPGDIDRLINVLIGERGEIAYDEFMGQLIAIRGPQEKELLLDIFNDADTDNSGYLTIQEVGLLMKKPAVHKVLGDLRVEEIMKLMDRSGSGRVSFDDFLCAVYGDSRCSDRKSVLDYKVGQEVEYYSSSFSTWMPCEVTRVEGSTGAIQISAKPDFWMPTAEVQKKIRPVKNAQAEAEAKDGTKSMGLMERVKAAGLGRQMLSGAMFGERKSTSDNPTRSPERKSTWKGDDSGKSKDILDDVKQGVSDVKKNLKKLFFG